MGQSLYYFLPFILPSLYPSLIPSCNRIDRWKGISSTKNGLIVFVCSFTHHYRVRYVVCIVERFLFLTENRHTTKDFPLGWTTNCLLDDIWILVGYMSFNFYRWNQVFNISRSSNSISFSFTCVIRYITSWNDVWSGDKNVARRKRDIVDILFVPCCFLFTGER